MRKIVLTLLVFLSPLIAYASEEFTVEGDIRHSDLEGGCWYLDAEGKHYEVTGDADQLEKIRIEGRHVKLLVRKESVASICMMGETIRIVNVLDTVRRPIDTPIYFRLLTGKIEKTKTGCRFVRGTDGSTYELGSRVPKSWRKVGSKFNRRVRVIPGARGFSKCGMEFVVLGAAPKIKK